MKTHIQHGAPSCKEEDDHISIEDGLEKYGDRSQSDTCIYRVHEQLRKVNKKAYVPEIVAIGPYHRHQESLKWMEKYKFRYLHLLLQSSQVSLDEYKEGISGLKEYLLEYYDDPMKEGRFLDMAVLDGCFIIQLVRKFNMPELREENDPIFKMDWVLSSLQRDLILFENQIPFPVLCKLFDLIESPNNHSRLIYLLFKFFYDLFPGSGFARRVDEISAQSIKHLLELVHEMWLPPVEILPQPPRLQLTPYVLNRINLLLKAVVSPLKLRPSYGAEESPSPSPRRERIRDSLKKKVRRRFHSATDLRENGVKFKRIDKTSIFNIKFREGVLWIPPLTIEERTECFFRNLMAFEQYSRDATENFVTDYIKFFDFLIDTPEDVEVLTMYGIIENWLGDSHEVHRMFKKINNYVTIHSTYSYAEIYDRVNAHCSTSVSGKIARMRRSLFGGSLAVICVTVVLTLLLCVVVIATTQTVYTARSKYRGI